MIDSLIVELMRKNFISSVFTVMGHLDATRSNIRSQKESCRVPKDTINKIGKYFDFVGISDDPDIVEDNIVGIVRDNKTNSLCFKYYDPNLYAYASRNKSKFEYIVVNWAIKM